MITDEIRNGLFDLHRLQSQRIQVWYGAMRVRIKAVDTRGDRVFITLEENNGTIHDVDKKLCDIPALLPRLKIEIEKDLSSVDLHIQRKKGPVNKKDYDIVSIWRINGEAVFMVFSIGFSASDYIRKNSKFRFARAQDKTNAVYLIPDPKGMTASHKTKTRLGIYCREISPWLTSNRYNLEVVDLAGNNVLKLVKAI